MGKKKNTLFRAGMLFPSILLFALAGGIIFASGNSDAEIAPTDNTVMLSETAYKPDTDFPVNVKGEAAEDGIDEAEKFIITDDFALSSMMAERILNGESKQEMQPLSLMSDNGATGGDETGEAVSSEEHTGDETGEAVGSVGHTGDETGEAVGSEEHTGDETGEAMGSEEHTGDSEEVSGDDEATDIDEDSDEEKEVVYLKLYSQGVDDDSVSAIQQQLMDLGFMEYAEPTTHYGPVTMEAVMLFQRQNDLKQDGIMGEQTLGMLMSGDAKRYLLKNGMDGNDIKRMQLRLYELGYLAENSQITGHYGDDTENAVKKLQEINRISIDGKAGSETIELLYNGDVKANLLSLGDKSDVVKAAQERLMELGYLTTTPDGVYGDDTVAAVKLFQSRNDIVVDGYLGPTTREVLNSSEAEANALSLGEEGDTIRRIQELLIKYGYMRPGSATGYYGEVTENAVKAFQSSNGLTVDGKVGKRTMARLTGADAGKAGSSKGGSSKSSSEESGSTGSAGDSGSTVSGSVSNLVSIAKSKVGCRYSWGSKGPNTFDCSGFVYWCLNQVGVKQSYITSYGWRSVGKYKKVSSFSNIKAGDIVVVYGHVGIAAGKGKVIDASSTSGKVVYRDLSSWWKRNFIVAWRIFD